MIVSGGSIEQEARSVRRGHFLGPTLFVVLLSAGLIGFKIWSNWRDTRPVADLKTTGARMTREPYARPELILRDRFLRAPRDGKARTLLVKIPAVRGDVRG